MAFALSCRGGVGVVIGVAGDSGDFCGDVVGSDSGDSGGTFCTQNIIHNCSLLIPP